MRESDYVDIVQYREASRSAKGTNERGKSSKLKNVDGLTYPQNLRTVYASPMSPNIGLQLAGESPPSPTATSANEPAQKLMKQYPTSQCTIAITLRIAILPAEVFRGPVKKGISNALNSAGSGG